MMQNQLSFESENLVVDYISFNLPGSDNTESIAKYLFEKFNFNSTIAKGQNGTTYDWFYLNRNQHQVSFRQFEYNPSFKSFWEGIFLELMLLNFIKLFKHKNLIGIF
jgi:hypothetical protein